jgi:L-aminopeptidase/D-esterase-like protein
VHLVSKVHAIMLAGGSAFGLDAATGAVRYLEERKVGFNVGVARVPIVPSAILFDLNIGSAKRRPDAAMGYEACLNANNKAPAEGSVGAGIGATVGKILGAGQATKSGIGSAAMDIGGGVRVGAIVAVNAFGDVIDPDNGKILAGVRSVRKGPIRVGKGKFADSMEVMKTLTGRTVFGAAQRGNTVIGVVATNAKFDKQGATKVARMAMNGLSRCIRPANTMLDGDTIFSLATGQRKADVNIVGAFAAEVMIQAILRAVRAARGMGGVPSLHEIKAR